MEGRSASRASLLYGGSPWRASNALRGTRAMPAAAQPLRNARLNANWHGGYFRHPAIAKTIVALDGEVSTAWRAYLMIRRRIADGSYPTEGGGRKVGAVTGLFGGANASARP